MPVTLLLVLIAMAHQGHVLKTADLLQQTESESLAMVFNDAIAFIDTSKFPKLAPILATELTP